MPEKKSKFDSGSKGVLGGVTIFFKYNFKFLNFNLGLKNDNFYRFF